MTCIEESVINERSTSYAENPVYAAAHKNPWPLTEYQADMKVKCTRTRATAE